MLADVRCFCDLLLCQSPNTVQPEAAELLFRELALDANHGFGGIPFLCLLFDPLLNDDLRPICSTSLLIQGRSVVVLHMIALFFVVIVFVGPGFPFKEVCLRIEIGAGQADDMFVGIGVNNGLRVFLVQGVDALPRELGCRRRLCSFDQ